MCKADRVYESDGGDGGGGGALKLYDRRKRLTSAVQYHNTAPETTLDAPMFDQVRV